MASEICYISSNCNQTPTAADWGKNNLVCYGSCNSILIYDPNVGGGLVSQTLTSHSNRVNSVKWLKGKDTDYETELVSGSADGTVILWTLKDKEYSPVILKSHTSNVNIVDGVYKKENRHDLLIVSVSMDCTIKIWRRISPTDDCLLSTTINLEAHICVGLKVGFLPTNELILACGLDNSKINIYLEDEEFSFKYAAVLVGHENWVRGIEFTFDGDDLVVASASQDSFIRVWRITSTVNANSEIPEYNKPKIITNNKVYYIELESVLAGHEGWVYSVTWSPKKLQLLSASIDKSMIIWEFDKSLNLWIEKIRVGEVGGNTLGFYGGLFNPSGTKILSYSYNGAFHVWSADETGNWAPCVTVGGHFGEVVDIGWEPKGEFLYSTSADKTTRIHAPWPTEKNPITWHEIARPQVHGYDLNSLAVISRYTFASGAEEKIIRMFQAPQLFIDNFKKLCKVTEGDGDSTQYGPQGAPRGASVPSLGLSNKAVFAEDNIADLRKDQAYPEESHFTAQVLNEPPTEESLLQNTLWPEFKKLYGHGYEIYSLAASPDGQYLASACKSTKALHASIIIWRPIQSREGITWNEVQTLRSHTLTVVQMQFSPDSNYLLSVSRDRRWSLFSKILHPTTSFNLIATTDKQTAIHTRIIWTCSWSHDSKFFATGSRDGKVVVWTKNDTKEEAKEGEQISSIGKYESASEVLELKNESVTALAFAPNYVNDSYLLAVGLENGFIYLYGWKREAWTQYLVLDSRQAHHLTVRRLAFRPVLGMAGSNNDDENILQLASCSNDTSVRIFNIFIDLLK